MSKIGDLIGGAAIGFGVSAVSALFMSGRSIGGIIPDVTIEEHHTDNLTITDHPVEQGASITDHAFKNPSEITMRAGWSNSNSIVNSLVSGSLFSGQINNVTDLYRQLLALQESRKVFDLITGKRTYTSMLIKSLAVTTDRDTENALIVTVGMRQVIIVQTSAVALKPATDQKSPQDTAALQLAGTRQPIKAVSQSALKVLSTAF